MSEVKSGLVGADHALMLAAGVINDVSPEVRSDRGTRKLQAVQRDFQKELKELMGKVSDLREALLNSPVWNE